jgi:sugar transferase (PEP-CTERM system associated)
VAVMKYSNTNAKLKYSGVADGGMSWKKEDPSTILNLTKLGRRTDNPGGISLGFPKQRWFLLVGDLVLIALAGILSITMRFGLTEATFFSNVVAFAITLLVYPSSLYVFDLYNLERSFRSWESAYRSIAAIIFGGLVSIIILYFFSQDLNGRGFVAVHMAVTWLLMNGWRWAYAGLFQSAVRKIPALILGAGYCGRTMYELLTSPFSLYEVKGFLDDDPAKLGTSRSPSVIGRCDQLQEIAAQEGADLAILAIPRNRSPKLIRDVLNARLQGIQVREMADVYEQLTGRIPVRYVGDQWLLFSEGFGLLHKEYLQKLKRLVDVVASSLLLLLTAPLFGLAALAIRFDSPGPVFYRQERVGKGQRIFTIYKFRSMRKDAEKTGARWASERDPRITRVGRWLRLTHIDELPQIWNVFKGDMSLVGPRPERPEFVQLLEQRVPYYSVRHSVQPGITGWAQVNYRYGASIEDATRKLESDLYYVKNMSVLLDLKIMLRTIGVVFLADGAR